MTRNPTDNARAAAEIVAEHPEPCPFCGKTGKIWRGKDCGPEFAGMDAISHNHDQKCPARGMHDLKRWNARADSSAHMPSHDAVHRSPINAGNIVYRDEEWVPLSAYQEAMAGWKAASAASPDTHAAKVDSLVDIPTLERLAARMGGRFELNAPTPQPAVAEAVIAERTRCLVAALSVTKTSEEYDRINAAIRQPALLGTREAK